MKPILMAGISIVNLALIFYTIAIVLQVKKRSINKSVLTFLTLGVIFDVSSTICMMIGSSKGIITLHGCIGYSSLAGMLIDTIYCYSFARKNGYSFSLPGKLKIASITAYSYWIIAYITGSIIIMMRVK
jgi:hypothetical protein